MNRLLLTGVMLAIGASAMQAQITDPSVREGSLPNGLRYYICRNSEPNRRADFYLARPVGSFVEEDDESGMAHFLEHLCFNGSEHFPGNSMIDWMASVGVKFGQNLNAYTATDETVYNICKVPTTRQSTLDSCLLVLRDWSCGLTLSDDAIDAERGVIKGEWRHRNTASNRMLQRAAPRLYPGSRYGSRLPMGSMEVVENFPPQKLRDFYARWYRPDAEAIIVTGDIDPDLMEERIKATFADILPKEGSRKAGRPEVYDNEELLTVVESDPEQSTETVQLYFKRSGEAPDEDRALREEIMGALVTDMLVERYDEIELSENAPFGNTGIGYTRYLLAKPKKALTVRARARSGKLSETARLLHREVLRASRLGFSDAEFENARREYADRMRVETRKDSVRDNTDIARGIVRYYLDGGILETPAQNLERSLRILDGISRQETEEWLRGLADRGGRNAVLLAYTGESDGKASVSEEELAEAFHTAGEGEMEPFTPTVTPEKLLDREPERGSIAEEHELGFFGATEIRLSNGVRVVMKQTDYKPGQIYVRGVGEGGLSQCYTPEAAPTMKLLNEVAAYTGAGRWSSSDLRRFCNGRDIKVSLSVANTHETVEAATSPADMEDAFRLMWLKLTSRTPDRAAQQAFLDSKLTQLERQNLSAVQVMGDSITGNVYRHHPLGMKTNARMARATDLALADSILDDRFSDFSDFTFYVTGDFEPEALRDCLTRYVATLPANGRVEKPRDIGYGFTDGSRRILFKERMETPTGIAYQFRHRECPYTLEHIIMASMTGEILKARLLADLREKRGWTYSVTTHGAVTAGMNADDAPRFMMPVYVKSDPAHTTEAQEVIAATISDMGEELGSEEFDKVREYLRKAIADNRRDNAYWLAAMRGLDRFGLDLDSGYDTILEAMTPADLSRFIRDYVANADTLTLQMDPE